MGNIDVLILLLIGSVMCANAGSIEGIKVDDNQVALKGNDLQLVCEISQFSNSDIMNVYKSDTRLPSSLAGISPLTPCFPSLCLTTALGRYAFSADSSHVFINITGIKRSEDQKWWTCAIGNQRKDLLLNVITVPTSLQYENPPSQDLDLAEKAVQLKCSTGCSYPKPTISWYYSESGKDSLLGWSSSGTDTTTACSDSEKTYFSTLSLMKYTSFPGNLQKTVKFKCSIQSFTGMSKPLYSSYSTDVQFAVKVSSATLKDGTNSVSEQLQVVNGESKTLTCDTDVSRPEATIVWYIGTVEKQRSMSNIFTFYPDNNYHNKKVYCKTFNIQPENQAVSSYQSTLQVQVQVSNVTLKDGSNPVSGQLRVVYGVSKTLTCETDVNRPAATIVWYIGSAEKQRSTSKNFTFTPDETDHYKKVYCKAFNTQPWSHAVTSYKSTIYVKGSVERIYVRDNKAGLKESDIQLVCEIPQFSNSDILSTYKSDTLLPSSLAGITSLTQCIPSLCLTSTIGRYTFSADSSHVFIHISRVNRSEDQKWWTCAIGNQRKNMLLTVITVPTSLQYENPPSQDQDLAENAVHLKCTTGCSYPRPTISWYYSESGKDSIQIWLSSGSESDAASVCSDSERIYSSTLSLPRYTTFPGNLQKNVKFKCSIQSFNGMSQPLYTRYSTIVQFAVQVSSVTLKDGSDQVSGQLQVVSGANKTLTCDTNVSRPAATIVWYIGSDEKQRSTSNTFTFTPDNSDNGKKVYCKAFNTQLESQAVISKQSALHVKAFGVEVDFSIEKPCYSKDDSMKMTAVYTGSGTVTAVQWYYSGQSANNLLVLASTCNVVGGVPAGYPAMSRMAFTCDVGTNTYTFTLSNLKNDDFDKSWGATFTLAAGSSPDVQEDKLTFCLMLKTTET